MERQLTMLYSNYVRFAPLSRLMRPSLAEECPYAARTVRPSCSATLYLTRFLHQSHGPRLHRSGYRASLQTCNPRKEVLPWLTPLVSCSCSSSWDLGSSSRGVPRALGTIVSSM